MLCEMLNTSRSFVQLMKNDPLPLPVREKLDGWLSRREAGEPLQYILGNTQFMGLKVSCDRRAFIPRPESEILCNAACSYITVRAGVIRILDMCTGSGAIGLAIAALFSVALTMTDLSLGAIELAKENADWLHIEARIVQGDLFEPVRGERFDVIVCNPPYARSADIPNLQREVLAEPKMALDGGEDGLVFYRRIAVKLDDHLAPSGAAFFEVGEGQSGEVARMMERIGRIEITDDLRGIPRVVAVYKDGG